MYKEIMKARFIGTDAKNPLRIRLVTETNVETATNHNPRIWRFGTRKVFRNVRTFLTETSKTVRNQGFHVVNDILCATDFRKFPLPAR